MARKLAEQLALIDEELPVVGKEFPTLIDSLMAGSQNPIEKPWVPVEWDIGGPPRKIEGTGLVPNASSVNQGVYHNEFEARKDRQALIVNLGPIKFGEPASVVFELGLIRYIGAKKNGWFVTATRTAVDTYTLQLSRWTEGVQKVFAESKGVVIKARGAIALTIRGSKIVMLARAQEAGSQWLEYGSSSEYVSDPLRNRVALTVMGGALQIWPALVELREGFLENPEGPTTVEMGPATGFLTPSLDLTAPTRIALGSTAGVSSTSLVVQTNSVISPEKSSGSAAMSAAITAPTGVLLNKSVGVGVTSLASILAPGIILMGASSGTSSPTLAVRTPTTVAMGASAGKGGNSLQVGTLNTVITSGPNAVTASKKSVFQLLAYEPNMDFLVRVDGGEWEIPTGLPVTAEGKTTCQHEIAITDPDAHTIEAKAVEWKPRVNLAKNPVSKKTAYFVDAGTTGNCYYVPALPITGPFEDVTTATLIEGSGGADGGRATVEGIVAGKTYTFSFYLYRLDYNSQKFRIAVLTPASANLGEQQTDVNEPGKWVRLSVTFTATESGSYKIVADTLSGSGVGKAYVTAVLAEETAILGTFFPRPSQIEDGFAEYTGEADNSTSKFKETPAREDSSPATFSWERKLFLRTGNQMYFDVIENHRLTRTDVDLGFVNSQVTFDYTPQDTLVGSRVGAILKYIDSNNYLYARIDAANKVIIGKVEAGVNTEYAVTVVKAVARVLGTKYRVKFALENGHVYVYHAASPTIDKVGEVALSAPDQATFGDVEGTAYLDVTPGSAEWRYDNLTLASSSLDEHELAAVINNGNAEAKPRIVLSGPMKAPVIKNADAEDPEKESIIFRSSAELAAGDEWIIDVEEGTLVDQDGNNRFDMLDPVSGWMTLVPGTNHLLLSADETGSEAIGSEEIASGISVSYRHTWS